MFRCLHCCCTIVLGRFQNSSVPVLILSTHSVPVPSDFTNNITFGSGFKEFGSAVLTVLILGKKIAQISVNLGVFDRKFQLDFL